MGCLYVGSTREEPEKERRESSRDKNNDVKVEGVSVL